MKSSLAVTLLTLALGCSSESVGVHPLNGKRVVLEGRWNALAKEGGQVICATDPKIVDVIDIGHLATPRQEQSVRVTAILHWRGMDTQKRQGLASQAVQLPPDGYVIRWSEARWESE
jgi:hypothetical protein